MLLTITIYINNFKFDLGNHNKINLELFNILYYDTNLYLD